MARNNRRYRKNASSPKKALRKRRARTTTSRSTPIDFIVRGARTLIGLLPGQTLLKPISDFIFGETRVSTVSRFDLIHGAVTSDIIPVIGLQVSMDLSPTTAIADSPGTVTSVGGKVWYSNYSQCCLKSLTVTTVSTCPTAKKSGMWGICIQPFTPDMVKSMAYRQITETPMSKFGPVTKPMTISFIPTPRYPSCYGMIPIGKECIRLFVAFEDPQDGTPYTSEDFGCNIQISGSVSLCCRGNSLLSYTRDITVNSEAVIYTSDGMTILESEIGSSVDDLNALVME